MTDLIRDFPEAVLEELVLNGDTGKPETTEYSGKTYTLRKLVRERHGKRRWSEINSWVFEDCSDGTLWEVEADVPLTENSGDFEWQNRSPVSDIIRAFRVDAYEEVKVTTSYKRRTE